MKDIYRIVEEPLDDEKEQQMHSSFSAFTIVTVFIIGNLLVGLLLYLVYLML